MTFMAAYFGKKSLQAGGYKKEIMINYMSIIML